MHDKLKPLKFHVFNAIAYWAAHNLIWKGYRRTIIHDDLWQLPSSLRSSNLWPEFEALWEEELKQPQ
jgi:hypothetical protein